MPLTDLTHEERLQTRIIGNEISANIDKYYKIKYNLSEKEFESLVLLTLKHLEESGAGQKTLENENKLRALSRSICYYLDKKLHNLNEEKCLEKAYNKKLKVQFAEKAGYMMGGSAILLGIIAVFIKDLSLPIILSGVIIGEGTLLLLAMAGVFSKIIEPGLKRRDAKALNLKKLEGKLDLFSDQYLHD